MAFDLLTSVATVTRPADTNAYAANDAVSDSTSAPTKITFSGVAQSPGGWGYIVGAKLETNQSTNTARFRLHLFHTSISAINDNAAYTMLDANKAARIGYIDFPAAGTEGSGSDSAVAQAVGASSYLPRGFKCDTGLQAIYGLLETKDAFTPASAQTFRIELEIEVGR